MRFQEAPDFARLDLHGYNNPDILSSRPNEYSNQLEERMANRGDIVVLSRELQQHIVGNRQNENGVPHPVEFGLRYRNRERPTITINYSVSSMDGSLGPFEIDNTHVNVIATGVFNCFFDALAAGLENNGTEISASELRNLAERRSIAIYMQLAESSDILNHPSVRNIELQLQSSSVFSST